MHVLLDSEPCSRCQYFRFETINESVAEPQLAVVAQPVAPPVAAKQAKRRPRGAADSTQRN